VVIACTAEYDCITTCVRYVNLLARVAVYNKPIAAGRREATVFDSSMVIDVVIADP